MSQEIITIQRGSLAGVEALVLDRDTSRGEDREMLFVELLDEHKRNNGRQIWITQYHVADEWPDDGPDESPEDEPVGHRTRASEAGKTQEAKMAKDEKETKKTQRWSIGCYRSQRTGKLATVYVDKEGTPMPYEQERVGDQEILYYNVYTDMPYREARVKLIKGANAAGHPTKIDLEEEDEGESKSKSKKKAPKASVK